MSNLIVSAVLDYLSDALPRELSNSVVVKDVARTSRKYWNTPLKDYDINVEWAGDTINGFPIIKVTGPVESMVRFACYYFSSMIFNADGSFTEETLQDVVDYINYEKSPLFKVEGVANGEQPRLRAELVNNEIIVNII